MSRYPDRPSCPCASCVRKRARKTELVGALYDLRREKGRCINHPTRKAHRGGRCRECWNAKLAAERERYAQRKGLAT